MHACGANSPKELGMRYDVIDRANITVIMSISAASDEEPTTHLTHVGT